MTDDATPKADLSFESLLAGQAPPPVRTRFQPLRMGMIGIWQYDEQEFFFHHGRLVLRGRNGSGKTKVLEVTSPFLFDANLTARRLDPFGTAARSMRDNLLYGEKKHQVGYVWCEYGRRTEDGGTEFRTLGAGMRAQAAKSGSPDSWYFLTDQRVGTDFRLYDERRKPASEQDLVDSLGAQAVFSMADSYRRAVASDLFGLTPERFRSLIELLITLRRPKLSENFGVARLSEILRDGLPPVDQTLVDDLAKGFDELARDQEDLQALSTASAEIDRFLAVYRTYARRMVRHIAAKVRSAVTRFDDVTRQATQAKDQLETAEQAVATLTATAEGLVVDKARFDGRIRALAQRPEVEQQAELMAMDRQAATARQQADDAGRRAEEAAADTDSLNRELDTADKELSWAAADLESLMQQGRTAARACQLESEHDDQVGVLANDPSAVQTILFATTAARKSAVVHARGLHRVVEKFQSALESARETHVGLAARYDTAEAEVVRIESSIQSIVEAAVIALTAWAEECRELRWSDADLARLLDAVERAGLPKVPALRDLVAESAGVAEAALNSEQAALSLQRALVSTTHSEVTADRQLVAAARELPPTAPAVARRDREKDDQGAPFWRLVEFTVDLPAVTRGRVEAALQGAGLLDAWVTPDGTALRPDTFDVFLQASGKVGDGENLLSVLKPVGDSVVLPQVVRELLATIGFLSHSRPAVAGPWVSSDGGWSIGPLAGRTERDEPRYIGATAREAARLRALAGYDERLAELADRMAGLDTELAERRVRLDRLHEERTSCPEDQQIRVGRSELDAALSLAEALRADVRQAEQRLAVARTDSATATSTLTDFARIHALPLSVLELESVETALGEYRELVVELAGQADKVAVLRSVLAVLLGRGERQRKRQLSAVQEHREATLEAAELTEAYRARFELVGADVSGVIAELEESRAMARALDKRSTEVRAQLQEAAEQRGTAKAQLAAVVQDHESRERDRRLAVDEFERLRRLGFLGLADVFGQGDGPVSLTRGIEDARRAESVLQDEDLTEKGRNASRNSVDERFRDLQLRISGPDWRPWGDNEGELFVVRVTHNGIDRTVPALRAIIEDEVETRKTYLDDQERKLFEEVLLGRIGEHLRQCRVEANSLRKRMNDLLAERPTASGLQMRLQWLPDDEAGPEVGAAVELLDAQSTKFLADEARDQLVGFLAERVRRAREDDVVGDWRVHLREALDYRRWSRFQLEVRHGVGDRWSPLSDAKHQQGSGGEKAVMLQLPLFVAAAAHYSAAASTAPRPVYLDEAFAGIDAEMRGSCLKLLTDLDLDFVLASHDEWGFHSEVPGLVTYSLYRDPATPGVLTTPFIWDGRISHRLDDPGIGQILPAEREVEALDG
jgi:uncharacterized protein (TIGR02680 family)